MTPACAITPACAMTRTITVEQEEANERARFVVTSYFPVLSESSQTSLATQTCDTTNATRTPDTIHQTVLYSGYKQ